VANAGETSVNGILDYVQGYVDEGITLTSMAFGMGNFNDALMEQLADKGNGNYYYIDTLDEAKELFVENLTSTLQVIARDAKVQIDFNPDVVSYYRLIGYENRDVADEDFRNDTVDAGEVGAGHSVTAIYAVHFTKHASGRIATMQMRWQDPDTAEVIEINGDLTTRGISRSFENTDAHYKLAVVAMQFAEVLRESPWGQDTDITLLGQFASGLRGSLRDADANELTDLIHRVDRIKGNGWPW
jgi:Ca-activated chloride channel homolog